MTTNTAPAHPTPHFTDLPPSSLTDRSSFANACTSLLRPLLPFFSPHHTRIRLGATATRFDESAAQLEGFTRSLWGLGSLLACETPGPAPSDGSPPTCAVFPEYTYWLTGIRNGTNPLHTEFWGWPEDSDQRMVEMAPLSFALIVSPQWFWDPLSREEKGNLVKWLGSVNRKGMPDTNWLWFRVMSNLALWSCAGPGRREEGRGTSELEDVTAKVDEQQMERDLNRLESFYRSEGWSNDGPEGYTQMDYYSGSFAIQLMQLIYVKIRGGVDGDRAERYKVWAGEFAKGFVHYFDEEGRAITFGRSLTYKFAMAGFWSALAFADLELPAPLTWGVVKGVLLRNLRWWTQQESMLTPQGTLSIGYCYPNQFLSENYNSPGSPYWFMLSFVALACAEDHPFWEAKEEPFPTESIPSVVVLKEPKHILVREGGHAFLLSSGQQCHYPMRAAESKYGKFAYSSAFGYSVPTGGYFVEAMGGDNTIALSDDDGETWKVRRVALDVRIDVRNGTPTLRSVWKPWKGVLVETILIPPGEENPNWHIRAHHITTDRDLKLSEGAFAIGGEREEDGRMLYALDASKSEGREFDLNRAVAVSRSGAVGIWELGAEQREGIVIDEDANSNLLASRSVLPALQTILKADSQKSYVSGVFALPASAPSWKAYWQLAWQQRPTVPDWLLAGKYV